MFIASGCQRGRICRCVYCLCWHISTICDTHREILDCGEKHPILSCNYHPSSLSTAPHNHSESEMKEELINVSYIHLYIPDLQLWLRLLSCFPTRLQNVCFSMSEHCLRFCGGSCIFPGDMPLSACSLPHINVFPCRYDSYGRLTNVTYPTGRVSSYRTDTDSSVRIQTEGSNKEDITVTTNLSASGTFYTLMQGECLLL